MKNRISFLVVVASLLLSVFVFLAGCDSLQQTPTLATGAATNQPAWWNEVVFYEIFVRSYHDSDGDGSGDLTGLIAKLDYLNDGNPATAQDLGVTGIWLMPVMQSPSYHGYDATDYYAVEEDYGSNEDFKRFIDEAHKRGIMVIVDLTLNHTSNEHPWFIEAASDPESDKRDWYVWRSDNPGHRTPWGEPVWFPLDNAYYHSIFWEGMPDLNYRNPAVTKEMYNAARFWIEEMGVDGFRLDAIRHLIEKDSSYVDTQETHQWLAQWNDFIDQIAPQALTVGEVWDDTAVVAPYIKNGEVDIAFEFSLAESIVNSIHAETPTFFGDSLAQALLVYPPGQFAPFLTNHDQNRVMTQLNGEPDSAKLAATLLLTLPGVPFIYYGEEIGMTGQKPDELIRTPMQWRAGPGAGFSSGRPWQPINKDYEQVNVTDQESDPTSLLYHYRRLIHLRNDHPALQRGSLQSLESSCDATYAYLRHLRDEGQTPPFLVVVNFSAEEQRNCAFSLDGSNLNAGAYRATDWLTGQAAPDLQVGVDGSFTGYLPLEVMTSRQGAVLQLAP